MSVRENYTSCSFQRYPTLADEVADRVRAPQKNRCFEAFNVESHMFALSMPIMEILIQRYTIRQHEFNRNS